MPEFEPDKYQEAVLRTMSNDAQSHPYKWGTLGLFAEAGELIGLRQKDLFKPTKQVNAGHYIDELGDVYYYATALAYYHNMHINELVHAEMLMHSNDIQDWFYQLSAIAFEIYKDYYVISLTPEARLMLFQRLFVLIRRMANHWGMNFDSLAAANAEKLKDGYNWRQL